jgi:hypothetical protein
MTESVIRKLSFLDRYLTLGVKDVINVGTTNIPIAVATLQGVCHVRGKPQS